MKPYWEDGECQLYHGDMREVLPALGIHADLVCADPPYQETSFEWDRWPDGWLDVAAKVSRSLWCFGSMRLFGTRWEEFTNVGWKFSQDVVWEKHKGSGRAADRFKRVHEHAAHWYQGLWSGIRHEAPRITVTYRTKEPSASSQPRHTGAYGSHRWTDDGTRITPSVIHVRSVERRTAGHSAEKPPAILTPLIEYACPPGGLIVDPFAGSCSTLITARQLGRRCIGIEADEGHCERGAERLSRPIQPALFGGVA